MSNIFRTAALLLIGVLFLPGLLQAQKVKGTPAGDSAKIAKPLVTFVELGSTTCIPCKKMQPVMKAIEEKYKGEVKVVFYDVRSDEGQPYSEKYNIRLIPTQVFLDANGKEFHRHEGFYPEEAIHKLLKKRGLTPRS
jgi:thioredoxin 1